MGNARSSVRRAAVAATGAALLALAACSGGEPDPTPEPGTEAPASPSGPSTAPPEATTAPAPPDDEATSAPPEAQPPEETTAPPATSEPEPEAEPASVTIGAAGDILPHVRVNESAAANAGGDGYDYAPMFEPVRDLLSAPDVSLCHLETPISADNTDLSVPRTLSFNTPREMGEGLAGAGFDGCDFASNHTFDRGVDGVQQTVDVLADAGLEYAGPTPSEEGSGVATRYDVDGVDVAQLAYSYTLLNSGEPNTDVPEGAPWMADALWTIQGVDGILEDAEAAKEDGADFVVLSMHWGTEYQTEPTEDQREMATELLESDAVDLIIGSHVHVVQPCETINGKQVMYGMGNFLSNQSPDVDAGLRAETQEGLIAQVDLERDAEGEVSSTLRYQPTRVDLDGHVIRPVEPGSETYERTVATLNSLGDGACEGEPIE